MSIPSVAESIRLLERYSVPEHIVRHSVQVANTGRWLVSHLVQAGMEIDLKLVLSACLLHDISKMYSIEHGGEHALLGCKLLFKEGYGQVGEIVRQHVVLDYPVSICPAINEAMVVNYADKRVRHDEIVSLQERFEYLFERYVDSEEKKRRMQKMYEETMVMEQKIFEAVPPEPADLPMLDCRSFFEG